jgi:hypothetical protein
MHHADPIIIAELKVTGFGATCTFPTCKTFSVCGTGGRTPSSVLFNILCKEANFITNPCENSLPPARTAVRLQIVSLGRAASEPDSVREVHLRRGYPSLTYLCGERNRKAILLTFVLYVATVAAKSPTAMEMAVSIMLNPKVIPVATSEVKSACTPCKHGALYG